MTQDHSPLPFRLGQAVLDAIRDCAGANTDVLITCDGEALLVVPADGRSEGRRFIVTDEEVVLHRLDAYA